MGEVSFMLNGDLVRAVDPDPAMTLLAYLRARGLTAAKEGCAEGECGACAVVMVATGGAGTSYESVNACLMLLAAAADREVWTAEGLVVDGQLHPVQEALVEHGGSQCGYCTPGFVATMFAEQHRAGRDGFDVEELGGNLCRCTGYRSIRDAARSLPAPRVSDPFVERLERPVPLLGGATLASHGRSFHRPTTLAELFHLLGQNPEARMLAGGTDLVVEMNQRGRRFAHLVSLEAVPDLLTVKRSHGHIEIGAAVPLTRIERELRGEVPLLDQLWPLFASRLVRNRATLGGNLGTASPVGDSAPVLLALDASVCLARAGSERVVPIDDFFTDYRRTVLRADEIIRAVRVPRVPPSIGRFYKVSKRRLDDISSVAAAFAVDLDGRMVTRARLAYGGVAATPVRALDAEQALVGALWNEATARRAASILESVFSPISDQRASADYRRAMVRRLFDKFFAETEADAHEGAAA